jgi:hypothetical protein
LDGIPRHLPALLRAEKLMKKARKAKLLAAPGRRRTPRTKAELGRRLFELARLAQGRGWPAEDALRSTMKTVERDLRQRERGRLSRAPRVTRGHR